MNSHSWLSQQSCLHSPMAETPPKLSSSFPLPITQATSSLEQVIGESLNPLTERISVEKRTNRPVYCMNLSPDDALLTDHLVAYKILSPTIKMV